jgi:hypothetical protein
VQRQDDVRPALQVEAHPLGKVEPAADFINQFQT